MTDLWIDIGKNLLGSLAWLLIVVAVGLLWYGFKVRPREVGWIRSHGLMLLIYFRNIDDRCCTLALALSDRLGPGTPAVREARLNLMKLESDLDAFERMTGLWARRVESLPLWYPYATEVRSLLEAQTQLHTALMRHVTPLRFCLEGLDGCTEADADRLVQEARSYAGYFRGEGDRVWGSSSLSSGRPVLMGRLQTVLEQMRALFTRVGAPEMLDKTIWKDHEDPGVVWFGQVAGKGETSPQARASSPSLGE